MLLLHLNAGRVYAITMVQQDNAWEGSLGKPGIARHVSPCPPKSSHTNISRLAVVLLNTKSR